MIIAPVILLKVVLEHLEGLLIASYQVSKQWCESTNRNLGLGWEKMWSLKCADLTTGCCLSQTLVFICLVDNSSRGVSAASLWHCCSAWHEVDFPVKVNMEVKYVQTPSASSNGLFMESWPECFGMACDFSWVPASGLLPSSAWKRQEGAHATVKMLSYKCLSHQREVGLVVLVFSFGKCFESELTSMKTGCWP